MESPTPLDLIKSIHKQGPTLQKNPEPGELAKGDVPGHEFHGNQYTGGGGGKDSDSSKATGYGKPNATISRTTSATDANGKSAGFRGVIVTTDNKGMADSAKYKGEQYYRTGKNGPSLGRHPTSAPKGTEMAEMATEGDKRIWVSHTGSHVHED